MIEIRSDRLTPEKRSWNMSRVKSKDTKPEIFVRKALHSAGFRFRLHVKTLPGKPDIVLPKWKTVIFVNGCFWHRHEGCKEASTPKTRTVWWKNKFDKNVINDELHHMNLSTMGWKVIVIWECELSKSLDFVKLITENSVDE